MRATVCGSFRKKMAEVRLAIEELNDLGVEVLSPSDTRIVGHTGGFLFLRGDPGDHRLFDAGRIIKMTENLHLASIARSDFVWLVTDGYVGPTSLMEVGFAAGAGVPVFATTKPDPAFDGMVEPSDHIIVVDDIAEAIRRVP